MRNDIDKKWASITDVIQTSLLVFALLAVTFGPEADYAQLTASADSVVESTSVDEAEENDFSCAGSHDFQSLPDFRTGFVPAARNLSARVIQLTGFDSRAPPT